MTKTSLPPKTPSDSASFSATPFSSASPRSSCKPIRVRDQRVKCTIPGCNRVLSGYKGLDAHIKAHIRADTVSTSRPPPSGHVYKCEHSKCIGKSFKRKEYLIRHMKHFHPAEDQQGVVEIYV